MKRHINLTNIKKFKPMRAPLTLQGAIEEASRCLLCEDAPCSKGCPAGTDPGKFIRQIRFSNFKGAARTIRNNNILGSVCAYICPVDKLCEKECTSKALADPIDIAGLQAFACEYGRKTGLEPIEKASGKKGKVAIIGAGPAGLSCAAELLKRGYAATVFDEEEKAGGVAMWGIPSFRLPPETLEYTVANLKELGAEFVCKRKMADKEAAAKLLSNGYGACFISTGLPVAAELPFLKKYDNVSTAADFLRAVKVKGQRPKFAGKSVVVIGGGSVAMDAAVTARGLGAERVYAVSLEGLGELPADKEEIEIATAAHVIFRPSSQITDVVADGKKAITLTGTEIRWREPGKFIPSNTKTVEGTEFKLRSDFVIQAIGQKAGAEIKDVAAKLKLTSSGTIQVKDDFSTGVTGIFAGGDITSGGATIAKAVGDGKKAAESIDNFLS